MLLQHLTREPDLDDSQREQIRAIPESSRSRVGSLQRDVRARFDTEQRTLREEILKVLRPDQQEKFERSLQRRQRGRGRGGPGR
jgi:Spy/CpxP family protein refolding chaperone